MLWEYHCFLKGVSTEEMDLRKECLEGKRWRRKWSDRSKDDDGRSMPDMHVQGREFGSGNPSDNIDYKSVKWEQHRLSLSERDRMMREGLGNGSASEDGNSITTNTPGIDGEIESCKQRRSSRKASCDNCECKDRFLNSVRASFESRSGAGVVEINGERSEQYDIFVDECERGFFGEGEMLC